MPLGLLRAFVQSDAADDGLTPHLLAELKMIARTPGLLVACNYGGTLCDAEGISTETLPLGSAAIALRALAALPNTHAAVISGRSLRDLAAVSRLPAEVHLVGSHGAEFDMGFAHGLSLATESVLQQASQALVETIGAYKGISIERKPVAVSVHTRPASPAIVAKVLEKAEEVARAHGLFYIVDGSVLDLSSRGTVQGRRPGTSPCPPGRERRPATPATPPATNWPWPRSGARTWASRWGTGPRRRPTVSGIPNPSPGCWPSCLNCAGRGCSGRTPSAWSGIP